MMFTNCLAGNRKKDDLNCQEQFCLNNTLGKMSISNDESVMSEKHVEINKSLLAPPEIKRLPLDHIVASGKCENLLKKLDQGDLEELKRYFFPDNVNYGHLIFEMGFHGSGNYGIPLIKEDFVTAVNNVIGNPQYGIAAAKLFDNLNKKQKDPKQQVIWWEQLLDLIINSSERKNIYETDDTFKLKEKENVLISHCKSMIVKILLPETPHSSCYVIISKLGNVGVYDDNLALKESYKLPMGTYHNAHNCWEVLNQKEWVKICIDKKVHNEEICEIMYIQENETVISCSTDSITSLTLREKKGKRPPYNFKLENGVRHFHLEKKLCLLATTSMEKVVRIWNPVVTDKPIQILKGHKERVVDVKILKHAQSIISLSEFTVLKVWSLEFYVCLQTIRIKFPVTGRNVEFSSDSIYPGLKKFPQSINIAYTTFRALQLQTAAETEASDVPSDIARDQWMRVEFIISYYNYIKVIGFESKMKLEYIPLPLPRKKLEPALPTPYYPLTHTFRENTKLLKARMFKNLAGLAPFYDMEAAATSFSYKCLQDINDMKKLVKHKVPHFGLALTDTRFATSFPSRKSLPDDEEM